jgi:hypothetical protein
VPKLVFPVAAVVSNIVGLLLSMIPVALPSVVTRHPFYKIWLYLPTLMPAFVLLPRAASPLDRVRRRVPS